jgi:hypothetical protein
MTRLLWDQAGERTYETGVDRGVLFPMVNGTYTTGVPWNGLVGVTESPGGAEATPLYADNIKYLNLRSTETFGGTIEAYTYPDEFALCDGSAAPAIGMSIGQQNRAQFALCYRTKLGNDTEGEEFGYKIHIIYGATASPSERAYKTVNDSPEAITFSWAIDTTPVSITGFKPTALVTIDSTTVTAPKLTLLEDALYGDDTAGVSSLLMPDAIVTLINGV